MVFYSLATRFCFFSKSCCCTKADIFANLCCFNINWNLYLPQLHVNVVTIFADLLNDFCKQSVSGLQKQATIEYSIEIYDLLPFQRLTFT